MARIVWHDIEALQGATGGAAARISGRLQGRRRTARRRRLVTLAARIAATPALWIARYRQRTLLAQLDARMLRDIGLTRKDARRECEKPFWR
jgi:uncharacterized protein YjiS (DUF1127 family)